jgi:mannose-1-phosphate guanylyltransferase/phosphomannomutase
MPTSPDSAPPSASCSSTPCSSASEGYWKDIGTLGEYLHCHADILSGKVEVEVDGTRKGKLGTDIWMGEGSQIDPTAKLSGAVIIGKNCKVGPKAELNDCILGDGSSVGEGARINGAVLWEKVQVGPGAELKECTIAARSSIGGRTHIGVGVIIADDCKVGNGCTFKDEVKMWPQKTLEDGATLSSSLVWGDKWSKNLFDAYGISGTANIEITPDFASKLGAACGASFKEGSYILITRDAHKTSRMIDRALMAGLTSAGVNVFDLRMQPIPVARYATRALKCSAGLHVRRSPLEARIQDIKFFENDCLEIHS